MGLKLVSPPASTPVDIDDVKRRLRVTFTDDDVLLESYLDAAISMVDGPDGNIGRALIDQTWDYYLDSFPGSTVCASPFLSLVRAAQIEIPLPPLIEVIGVFYQDADGNEQQMDAADYIVDTTSEPGTITLAVGAGWPSIAQVSNAVRIRFRAGYLDTSSPPLDNVPEPIKVAIILITESFDNNDSDFIKRAQQLLQKFDVRVPFA